MLAETDGVLEHGEQAAAPRQTRTVQLPAASARVVVKSAPLPVDENIDSIEKNCTHNGGQQQAAASL
jgi:hypothetical protein